MYKYSTWDSKNENLTVHITTVVDGVVAILEWRNEGCGWERVRDGEGANLSLATYHARCPANL
jgi:hypothetical protein